MTISYVAAGTFGAAADTAAPFSAQTCALPAGVSPDDLLIAAVITKPFDTTVTASGYTEAGSVTSGSVAMGGGTGSVRATGLLRTATGSDACSVTPNAQYSPMARRMIALRKTVAGDWDTAATTGQDTTETGTGVSATGAAALDLAVGDHLVVIFGGRDGQGAYSSVALTASNVTLGAVTVHANDPTETGNDAQLCIASAEVTAVSGTPGAPVLTATATSGDAAAAAVFVRAREPAGSGGSGDGAVSFVASDHPDIGFGDGNPQSFPVPAGAEVGDLLLIEYSADADGALANTALPSGFAEILTSGASGTNLRARAGWIRLPDSGDGTPPDTYSVATDAANADGEINAVVLRGALSSGDPIADVDFNPSPGTTSQVAPSVDGVDGGMLVCFWVSDDEDNTNWRYTDVPAGMTLGSRSTFGGAGGTWVDSQSAYEALTADDATGTRTAPASSSSGGTIRASLAISVVVKPEPAGGEEFTGEAAAALDGVTATAAGTQVHTGDAAATLDGVTGDATGEQQQSAAAAATLDGVTATAAGTQHHDGSIAATLEGAAAAAAGQVVDVSGQADVTLDGVTAAAAGVQQHAGTVDVTLDGVAGAASSETGAASGTVDVTLDGVAATAAATQVHTGGAVATLAGVTAAAAGVQEHAGGVDVTLDGVAGAAAGVTANNVAAVDVTLDGVAADAAGAQALQATVAATLDGAAAAGSGRQEHAGTVDVALQGVIADGESDAGRVGTVDVTLDGVTAAASGGQHHTGTADATLDGVSAAAEGTLLSPAAAAATLDGVSSAVAAAVVHSGDAAGELDGVVAAAAGQVIDRIGTVDVALDGVAAAVDAAQALDAAVAAILDGVTAAAVGEADRTGGRIVTGSGAATVGGVTGAARPVGVVGGSGAALVGSAAGADPVDPPTAAGSGAPALAGVTGR